MFDVWEHKDKRDINRGIINDIKKLMHLAGHRKIPAPKLFYLFVVGDIDLTVMKMLRSEIISKKSGREFRLALGYFGRPKKWNIEEVGL